MLTRSKQTYLRQCVLLLGSYFSIAEEKGIVLELHMSDCTSSDVDVSYLVEQILDLLELLLRQCSWIDTLDFTTKVGELGRVRGRRKRERGDFDGHPGGDGRKKSRMLLICRTKGPRGGSEARQHDGRV